MESQDLSPTHGGDASRPSLGFPLGTALLLIVIFSLSGIFSCCYHWDKLRSFRQSLLSSDPEAPHTHDLQSNSTPNKSRLHSSTGLMESKGQSLSVLMPGDDVPKFIAMPCPCQPSRPDKITVSLVKPPPKPPRMPVPLY